MEQYAIETSNLTMKYKKKSNQFALEHINIQIHENQMIGLIGANGSGKTTFFNLCNGLLEPTEGTLHILGKDGVKDIATKNEMIYSTNNLSVSNIKVKSLVQTYNITYPHFDMVFAEKLLNIFHIPMKKNMSALSLGMVSIVHFVCALATRSKITLLDEPFNGIDIEKRKLAYEVLLRDYMEHPRTFIIASHNLSELENVLSEMILIHQGKVIFYEDMDEVREMLFRADGTKEEIEKYSKREQVCFWGDGELGSYLIGRGSVRSEFATLLEQEGMLLSAVAPEDVCVYLTTNRKEDELECLWN